MKHDLITLIFISTWLLLPSRLKNTYFKTALAKQNAILVLGAKDAKEEEYDR